MPPPLVDTERAGHSAVGLVLAAVSLVVMPLLSAAQRRAGRDEPADHGGERWRYPAIAGRVR